MKKKYYAVKNGKKVGIFESWDACKELVHGFKDAKYKSFKTRKEAKEYLEEKEIKPPKSEVWAYVDGSFNESTQEYGAGVLILYDEEEVEISRKGNDSELAKMRNVAGELLASLLAMQYFDKNTSFFSDRKLLIFHDYTGIEFWATNEWKTNKEGTKKYKDKANQYMNKHKVEFVKVKAHSGNKYNEKADLLAKSAVNLDSSK